MALNRDKTHCKRGHPIGVPDGAQCGCGCGQVAGWRLSPSGKRQCRACIRIVRAERATGVESTRVSAVDMGRPSVAGDIEPKAALESASGELAPAEGEVMA